MQTLTNDRKEFHRECDSHAASFLVTWEAEVTASVDRPAHVTNVMRNA